MFLSAGVLARRQQKSSGRFFLLRELKILFEERLVRVIEGLVLKYYTEVFLQYSLKYARITPQQYSL
jgi:hypothetical protein